MPYRLSQKNNARLVALSAWLRLPKDLLFTKMIEHTLKELEETKDLVDLTNSLEDKYSIAQKYQLLED